MWNMLHAHPIVAAALGAAVIAVQSGARASIVNPDFEDPDEPGRNWSFSHGCWVVESDLDGFGGISGHAAYTEHGWIRQETIWLDEASAVTYDAVLEGMWTAARLRTRLIGPMTAEVTSEWEFDPEAMYATNPVVVAPASGHYMLEVEFTILQSSAGAWAYFDNFRVAACPADFNSDGGVDSDDFFDFMNAFSAGSGRADFNGDGTVDSDDFFSFLNMFLVGC